MRLLHAALDALFPPRCAACLELLPPVDALTPPLPICDACEVTLEPAGPRCHGCARRLDAPGLCDACALLPPAFDGVSSAFLYGGAIAQVLHRFKYGDEPHWSRALALDLAKTDVPAIDVVCAVPMHERRRRRRTYDQAALLGVDVARELGEPFEHLLVRVRETSGQVGRRREERAASVEGAFAADGRIEGRRVLLVDDVVTTGATANECARVLKSAGAALVWVVSAARAE